MIFRDAREDDLPYVISLLADDQLGAKREQLGDPAYKLALARIDADPSTRFIVAEEDGVVVACMQLSIRPGIARRGVVRAQLESMRVLGSQRRQGIGEAMVQEAMRLARDAGCGLMELTSDLARKDAHRFWERQGFKPTHVGMKLAL